MKTDIQEHDDGYTLEMDLPGYAIGGLSVGEP